MANISTKVNKYKEKIEDLEKKNNLLNGEVNALMKDNEKLCKSVNEVDVKLRMDYNEKLERKEDEMRLKSTEYEAKLLQHHHTIQQCNNKIGELTTSQKVLQNQALQYKQTIESMNKEIIKLENELKHLKSKNAHVDDEFRRKDSEIQAVKTSVAVLGTFFF